MKKYIIGVLLFAGITYAAIERVDKWGSAYPIWFNKGLYVGPDSPNPTNDRDNKVTRLLSDSLIYDFPALSGSAGAGVQTTVCAYSNPLTITGVRFGDGCSVGVNTGQPSEFGLISPVVTAASTVKIQACALGYTDGGTFDMPDASYTVHCRSNQP